MKTSDFNFDLPQRFIAQDPVEPRDASRLLIFDTANGRVYHKYFSDIIEFLTPDDVLVLNKSKVIPARILFDVDGVEKEIFVLKNKRNGSCQALVKPGKYFKLGRKGCIEDVEWRVDEILYDGSRIITFDIEIDDVLQRFGSMPLPPYINESHSIDSQYQTVYAKESGSVAAPTAGLHFTDNLLCNLQDKGVDLLKVVLHVGRGTFLPVTSDDIGKHEMHSEEFELSNEVSDKLNDAKSNGRRIVAVGTTSVRVLESGFDKCFTPGKGSTDIFIYPGKYKWKCVDRLISNFHLPKSTLIMLVASFLENKGVTDPVQKVLELYELAKAEDYRFYSFGDAMLII